MARTMLAESESFVLYHGTSEAAATIRREGLKAGRHGAVFLTDNPELAIEYAESDQDRSGLDFVTIVSIDAARLDQSLLCGDLDHSLTDDWRESLRETDQCMYRGDIPPNLFVTVAGMGEASVDESLNVTADYVIKDDKTYRTFVGDGKRWSMRETDGQVFPDYRSAERKRDELQRQFPKRRFFTQMVKFHDS